jgi:outer membrane protein, heavy metal efflux system
MKIHLVFLAVAIAMAFDTGAAPLTLAEAQRRAALDAPPLNAQTAALEAAKNLAVGAAELPDPKLVIGLDNVPADGANRFSIARDGMTMRRVGFMQDFVRSEKRQARAGRAAALVAREESMLVLARANLERDVAVAWIERHFAERQLALLIELEAETALQARASLAQFAGARGESAEPLGAHMALEQLKDRIDEARRQIARALVGLKRWIGVAAEEPLAPPPAFDRLDRDVATLGRQLNTHPQLAVFASSEAAADAELKLAQAAGRPDWTLELAWGQRGSSYSNLVSLGVRIDLPIFQSRRQEPTALAMAAELARVRAQALDAERAHAADIDLWLADWNSARTRLERNRGALAELARRRVETAQAAFRGGKGELGAVLEARRAEIDIRLNALAAEAELARAWAQLNFMLPPRKESP